MNIINISISSIGSVDVLCEGGFRYCLVPGQSLDGQPQEVVDAANSAWTPEVLAAYQALLARNLEI